MASSTSTMEVDEGEKKAEEDDISSKAKKYVAEKRKLAGGGNGGEGTSASVPIRSSTSSAIFKVKTHSLRAPNLNGQDPPAVKNYGSFYSEGDNRIVRCKTVSTFESNINASYSFDPATMQCHQCQGGPHGVIRGPGSGADADIFVLADQNFPPALPTATGKCLAIVRIENGTLAELAEAFLEIAGGWAVGVGTLVLLASASHLGAVGLAGYAEDLVRATKLILNALSGRVTVRAGPMVLLTGTDDPALIRAMAEMVGWITTLRDNGEGFPGETLKAELLSCRNLGLWGIQSTPTCKIQLPVSLLSFEKKTWTSGGWDDLPNAIGPMDSGTEKFVIETLISELNNSFPLNLDPKPCLAREVAAAAHMRPRLVLVGLSHARHLAESLESMGASVSLLKLSSCRPTTASIEQAAQELSTAVGGDEDAIVIFQFLDNSAYYARTEDGCLVPAQRGDDNLYHLVGDLVIAPKEMFLHSLKTSLPLFKAAGNRRKLMLSPLPRYLSASCCMLAGHVQNRDDTGFVEKVTEDLSTLKRQIKDFCHINHLGATTCLNTAVLMTNPDGGRSLRMEERDHLLSLWGPDPVHPRPEGYKLLATNILALLEGESDPAESGSKPAIMAAKRKRWEEDGSVAVRQHQHLQRGNRGSHRGHWRRGWGRIRRY